MAPCAMEDERLSMPLLPSHAKSPTSIYASVLHGPKDIRLVSKAYFHVHVIIQILMTARKKKP